MSQPHDPAVPSNSAVVGLVQPGNALPTTIARVLSWRASNSRAGLHCGVPGDWVQRIEGLCTLDVNVRDEGPEAPVGPVYTAALKLRVQYRSLKAEGDFLVDAASGQQLRIGAVDTISVDAFFEPRVAGEALLVGTPQRVDVSAHWSTSRGGIAPTYTPPAVAADVFLRIPPRAAYVVPVGASGQPLTGVVATFSLGPDSNTDTYEAPAVGADDHLAKIPVAAGSRFVRFGGAGGVVYPVFHLFT